MKRATSLLFLALILLNTMGYYGLLTLSRQKSVADTIHKIQENENATGGNMVLRVPVSIPYAINSRDYEPIEGEVSFEGQVFRILRQRLYNDTLYIVCMKDPRTTEVDQSITDYLQSFASPSSDKHTGIKIQMFAKDYIISSLQSRPASVAWCHAMVYPKYVKTYSYNSIGDVFRPPKA